MTSAMTESLWSLKEGEAGVLSSYGPDLAGPWLRRLREVGFAPGETITCVTAPRFGAPRVYRVGTTFFSVEDQIARHLLIEA